VPYTLAAERERIMIVVLILLALAAWGILDTVLGILWIIVGLVSARDALGPESQVYKSKMLG
jgi:hypothetical protein